MSDTPFYNTRMGHRFFESTMPALVKQLERLNELLERLVDRLGGQSEADSGGSTS